MNCIRITDVTSTEKHHSNWITIHFALQNHTSLWNSVVLKQRDNSNRKLINWFQLHCNKKTDKFTTKYFSNTLLPAFPFLVYFGKIFNQYTNLCSEHVNEVLNLFLLLSWSNTYWHSCFYILLWISRLVVVLRLWKWRTYFT